MCEHCTLYIRDFIFLNFDFLIGRDPGIKSPEGWAGQGQLNINLWGLERSVKSWKCKLINVVMIPWNPTCGTAENLTWGEGQHSWRREHLIGRCRVNPSALQGD